MNPRTPGHTPAAPSRISPARRLRPRSVLALGGGLAVAGALTAAAVPLAQAAPNSPNSPTTTIRLISVTKAMTRIPSGGVEVDVDQNSGGRVVGADSLICHVVPPSRQPKCAVSIDLAGGDLFFVVTGTRTGAAGRFVGGTGRYAGDSGTVTATNTSATKSRVVIRLHR
jgi:hypothetical protein